MKLPIKHQKRIGSLIREIYIAKIMQYSPGTSLALWLDAEKRAVQALQEEYGISL